MMRLVEVQEGLDNWKSLSLEWDKHWQIVEITIEEQIVTLYL